MTNPFESNPFDDNADPFADPSEGDFFGKQAKASVEGALLAFQVKDYNPNKPTSQSKDPNKPTPMVLASVYVVDGPNKGKKWENSECYGAYVAQLRDHVGGWVIGRWVKGKPNPQFPDNPPWHINPASPEDRALGKAWYDANVKQQASAA
jgi:hypothetical protein